MYENYLFGPRRPPVVPVPVLPSFFHPSTRQQPFFLRGPVQPIWASAAKTNFQQKNCTNFSSTTSNLHWASECEIPALAKLLVFWGRISQFIKFWPMEKEIFLNQKYPKPLEILAKDVEPGGVKRHEALKIIFQRWRSKSVFLGKNYHQHTSEWVTQSVTLKTHSSYVHGRKILNNQIDPRRCDAAN